MIFTQSSFENFRLKSKQSRRKFPYGDLSLSFSAEEFLTEMENEVKFFLFYERWIGSKKLDAVNHFCSFICMKVSWNLSISADKEYALLSW